MYKNRPTVRVMTGLFLILLSYVIGWPAVGALGLIAVYAENPLWLVIGGPIVYGLSHVVFIIGLYLAGKDYAAALWKRIKAALREKKWIR